MKPLPPGYARAVPIGAGAFGEVWRAREVSSGRWVALKRVADPQRQRVEAEVLALGLRALPQLHAAVTHRGGHWIAMEYVHGVSLREAMGLGLSRSELAALGHGLALALVELHRTGRAHGDLKPENVLVQGRDGVRLVDLEFSGARQSRQGGTAGYCAPEAGDPSADPRRADLWSLGVILHELLCGARPGSEERTGAWPRLRAAAPDWVGLVDCLVRTDPKRRPPTAIEAVADLPPVDPSSDPAALLREAADQKLAALLSAQADRLVRRSRGSEAMPLLQEALDLDPDQTQALEVLPRVRIETRSRSWIVAVVVALACMVAAGVWKWRESPSRTPVLGGMGEARERIHAPRSQPAISDLPLRERTKR